jgi:AmiR/NasT family two-component response regulator
MFPGKDATGIEKVPIIANAVAAGIVIVVCALASKLVNKVPTNGVLAYVAEGPKSN